MASSFRYLFVELLIAAVWAAVAAGLVVAVSRLGEPVYEATVTWPTGTGDVADARTALEDEALLFDALRRLGFEDPGPAAADELRERLTMVEADTDGEEAVRLTATAASADLAAARAAAVADAIGAGERMSERTALQEELEGLDRESALLVGRIREMQVLGGSDAEVAELIERREAVLERREEVAARLETAMDEVDATGPEVTTREVPRLPAYAVAIPAALAGLASLALGARRRRGDTVRGGSLTGAEGLQVLAAIPRAVPEDPSPVHAAVARLRLALMTAAPRRGRTSTFLITSAVEGQGATTVACLLAEDFARLGHRTLLVDGDLWEPSIAERYGLGEVEDGAHPMLAWLQDPESAHRVVRVEVAGLHLLDVVPQFRTVRPAPGHDEELFDGFPYTVRRWSAYDVVIIDSAAVLEVPDTRYLAPHVTGAVLVTDRKSARPERTVDALGVLQDVGARLLGIVSNDLPAPDEGAADAAPGLPTHRAGRAESTIVSVDDLGDREA